MSVAVVNVDTEPFYDDSWHAGFASGLKAENFEGSMNFSGWFAESEDGYLKLELPREIGYEGALEIDLESLDWERANLSSGFNRKIHFLNLFSNSFADHHYEDGGTDEDAIITLRMGSDRDGNPRYGNTFKVLWASKGAKRSPGSDYHETLAEISKDYRWPEKVTFRVEWSRRHERVKIMIEDRTCADLPWRSQVAPIRFLFLGKSKDFYALQGVTYKNLRLYQLD